MEELILTAEDRADLGTRKSRKLRRNGFVPCVLYARSAESYSLKVKYTEFEKILKKGARIIDLKYAGKKDKVLIKDVQYSHLGDAVIHIDFNKIAMDELITLDVKLILKGKPKGVLEEGGVLDQYLKDVKISCLPANIPESIEVDVSELKLEQNLFIKDIKPPTGVKLLQEPNLVVAIVTIHKVEEVAPAVAAEPGPTEPEVIKKEEKVEEVEEEEEKAKIAREPAKTKVEEKGKEEKKEKGGK